MTGCEVSTTPVWLTGKVLFALILGSDLKRFRLLNSNYLDIAVQLMEYRYRILHQRYLGKKRKDTYRNLIIRLVWV